MFSFGRICGGDIAVGIDVLAEEGDLLVAARFEVVELAEDRLYVARALASASIRNDAIGAEILERWISESSWGLQ